MISRLSSTSSGYFEAALKLFAAFYMLAMLGIGFPLGKNPDFCISVAFSAMFSIYF
jgi:hypothetical protein